MNTKQEMFVNEYLIDYNATQAAIRAGYSERTARSIGQQLLTKLDIKNAIKEQREKIQNDNIATAKDVEEFLSLAMNDEIEEEQVLMSPNGELVIAVTSSSVLNSANSSIQPIAKGNLLSFSDLIRSGFCAPRNAI